MNNKIDYRKLNFEVARQYLEGKNVVFTGRGFLVRGELMRLARQAGANVDSVVTKKCDILIVGEKPGSKLRKAKVLGCEIITTDLFREILEGTFKYEKVESNNNILEFNLMKENSQNILNISLNNKIEERLNIKNKDIVILVKNDILKQKTISNIKKYGGNAVESFKEGKPEILVYQPCSEFDLLLEDAEKLNIKVLTVGQFNKLII